MLDLPLMNLLSAILKFRAHLLIFNPGRARDKAREGIG